MSAEETADQTKLQFWLSGVTERQKRLGEAIDDFRTRILDLVHRIMVALSERGPPDYDIRRDEKRALVSVLRDLLKEIRSRPPPSMNNGDDSAGVKKWIAGVGAVLATAFILAGWTISNQVAGQSVQIENLINQVREQNARITRIEQQQNERR